MGLPLALAFAFGTNTWMISSQALWQYGTGELLIALASLLIVADASPLRIALVGAVWSHGCELTSGRVGCRCPRALHRLQSQAWLVVASRWCRYPVSRAHVLRPQLTLAVTH
jgi:hypothetical protein